MKCWTCVYLASEAGWCEAKKGFHFFSWNPSVLYIFSRPSRIIKVSILLTLYDIRQSPAETARHLTAVFSLLGHQRVYPWKLSWVFQPQVVLHHSVLLWTASQMQVRTETGSWHAHLDNNDGKPTNWPCVGVFCVPSLSNFWNSVNIYC